MSFADAYPHLWDAIFSAAPYPSLLRLRATSKSVRDEVDARLCSHLAIRLPGDEVRAIMDDELVRLPADWRTHAKSVHTLSLVPSVRTVSLPNAADLICSFTPTSGDVLWTMDRISMGEAFDRLEALSGFSAWNAAGHLAAWASQECWCGARRGVPIPLLAEMAALVKVKTIRSWGMHVCAIPIIAERIVFHSLLSDGPYSPPTTLVATISTTGDNPGIRPWSPSGTVTNAAIHITGAHPRQDVTSSGSEDELAQLIGVKFVCRDEYRKSIGDDMYALEAYYRPLQ
ncbi:hypothetical protein CspHIS471_0310770 [Cutaneotrichosporon sp. HIS471]|nr:hypothetical protein CspHIS471_0310770 [Cutaneotrichosporon sp. HIS471]